MSDLRKAAEMALKVLCVGANEVLPYDHDKSVEQSIQALRQALAQPEQEQYVTKVVAMHEDGTYTTERIPLPKREWVGLTDEEVSALLWKLSLGAVDEDVRTIEAKLKEKNT